MVAALAVGAAGGYAEELRKTEDDIAALQASLSRDSRDIETRTRLAYRLYHRATLTEDPQAFLAAEKAINGAMSLFGAQEDLCLLKANLDFRFHRLQEVESDLRMSPNLWGRFEAQSLVADLDFQLGRYQKARTSYEALIAQARTWDNLARLAHYLGKMGDFEGADRLYVEAEDELTAKEMRSFAWVELQRGVLDVARGRYGEAAGHYQRADRAFPGYTPVQEHMAEVLAATGRFDEAVALYTQVIDRMPKPELLQTLGELYVFRGDAEEAAPYFDRALAAYLESAGRGEVHYYHHLTDLYADVLEDGAAALEWAHKDLALRENFSTQAALAWACFRSGEVGDAVAWIGKALTSGAVSAELFHQAAAIYGAAGRPEEHARFVHLAAKVNPRYGVFHVHR